MIYWEAGGLIIVRGGSYVNRYPSARGETDFIQDASRDDPLRRSELVRSKEEGP